MTVTLDRASSMRTPGHRQRLGRESVFHEARDPARALRLLTDRK